jgi:hypothetical protein
MIAQANEKYHWLDILLIAVLSQCNPVRIFTPN